MSTVKPILAMIPGVFYRKPSPDAAHYAEEGQNVKAGDAIGLIEIMKNFYEIKAEENGVIKSFKVGNEEIVFAGQEIALLKIK